MTPAGVPEPFVFRHATQRVVFGWNAVGRLAEIVREFGCRRGVIVADAFFAGGAAVDRIAHAISPLLASPPALAAVPPGEPDTGTVLAVHAVMRACDPDLVVALGGGSAMDAAKVARIMLANPGAPADLAGFAVRHRPHASLLVCIPTTAGTGSEVSEMAVVSQAGSDVKLRFRSAELAATIALLDPALTVSMPPAVTAHTGFDAFTHALESYVSRAAGPMTEPFSRDAMARLVRYLPVAFRQGDHAEARSQCLIASMQTAVAFNSTMLGMAHAIAAPLGNLFHVTHGLANALALPAVTAYNEPVLGAKAGAIAALCGTATAADGVARLRREVGLDLGLDDFVASDAGREALAMATMKSGNMATNPRDAAQEDVRAVIAAMRRPTGGRVSRALA